MKHINILTKITVLLLIIAYSARIYSQGPPPVPASIFDELKNELHKIDSTFKKDWTFKEYCKTNYGVELFNANSNNGEQLLNPQNFEQIKKVLDISRSNGSNCISINLNYPILVTGFSNSDKYLKFYKDLVAEIKKRGFKIFINCQTTATDTTQSKLSVQAFYTGLNSARYKAEKRQMIETIINELQPHYLSIENEPKATQKNTGLIFTADSLYNYINYFTKNLNKQSTKIGCGIDNKEDEQYIKKLVTIKDIDFIDLQVKYVYKQDFVAKSKKIKTIAAEAGKSFILNNCQLFKISSLENEHDSLVNINEVLSRNVFNTYIKVDSLYIEYLYLLSNMLQSEVCNLAMTPNLYAYIIYDKYIHPKMKPWQLLNLFRTAVNQNIQNNQLSVTGLLYKKIYTEHCNHDNIESTATNKNIYSIYPVPANDLLKLSINLNKTERLKFSILDIRGKVVKSNTFKCAAGINELSVNCDNLPAGVYFYEIKQTDKISKGKLNIVR